MKEKNTDLGESRGASGPRDGKGQMKRIDRTGYSLDDALREIGFAEAILDGMGADGGITLWGRIASIKKRNEKRCSKGAWSAGGNFPKRG